MNVNSITKIFSTINNTLNIMSKAMPIYKEIKPIINNINKTFKNNNIINTLNKKQIKNNISEKKIINEKIYNNPRFFI